MRIHQGRQHQRLAARAGAEIHHHVVALRREQEAEQLAAFVLHFDLALGEQRILVQRDLFLEADADRRVGRGTGLDLFIVQLLQHFFPLGQQRVDADIQRRALLHGLAYREDVFVRISGAHLFHQPIRQFGLYR